MPLIVLLVLIILAVVWWLSSKQAQSLNERIYLRRRGYDTGDGPAPGAQVARDTRLLTLLDSLGDVTPYSRQRAAEEIAQMCESGQSDPRMLAPLIAALDDDDNAGVRGAVASALGSLGDARAIGPLKRTADTDDSIHVRAAARKAVEKLGGEDALRPSSQAKS